MLLQHGVAAALLDHVHLQLLHGRAHALHVLLQRGVPLLKLHVGFAQLPQLCLTGCEHQPIPQSHKLLKTSPGHEAECSGVLS